LDQNNPDVLHRKHLTGSDGLRGMFNEDFGPLKMFFVDLKGLTVSSHQNDSTRHIRAPVLGCYSADSCFQSLKIV